MESWGFDYDIANNGEEAFELARRYCGCFDLGIFDVTMPVMDGIDATERIRSEVGYFPILGHSTDPDVVA
jgi:CheY-like chemotaxis protein